MKTKILLKCEHCYSKEFCPKHEEAFNTNNGLCLLQIENPFENDKNSGKKATLSAIREILSIQFERTVRSSMFEKMRGGRLSETTSDELKLLGEIMKASKFLDGKEEKEEPTDSKKKKRNFIEEMLQGETDSK